MIKLYNYCSICLWNIAHYILYQLLNSNIKLFQSDDYIFLKIFQKINNENKIDKDEKENNENKN